MAARRLQLQNGEWRGVNLVCTRNRSDTVRYLTERLASFIETFDPRRPPRKTMECLKAHIDEEMRDPTFLEYLRLRSIPGIGDVKAMGVSEAFLCVFPPVSKNRRDRKLKPRCLALSAL